MCIRDRPALHLRRPLQVPSRRRLESLPAGRPDRALQEAPDPAWHLVRRRARRGARRARRRDPGGAEGSGKPVSYTHLGSQMGKRRVLILRHGRAGDGYPPARRMATGGFNPGGYGVPGVPRPAFPTGRAGCRSLPYRAAPTGSAGADRSIASSIGSVRRCARPRGKCARRTIH